MRTSTQYWSLLDRGIHWLSTAAAVLPTGAEHWYVGNHPEGIREPLNGTNGTLFFQDGTTSVDGGGRAGENPCKCAAHVASERR